MLVEKALVLETKELRKVYKNLLNYVEPKFDW